MIITLNFITFTYNSFYGYKVILQASQTSIPTKFYCKSLKQRNKLKSKEKENQRLVNVMVRSYRCSPSYILDTCWKEAKDSLGSKGLTNFYCCKLCTFPFFITFRRAVFASSSVSTVCPSSKVTLCILNCKEKEKQLASKQKQRKSWKFMKIYMNSCGWIDTCAP